MKPKFNDQYANQWELALKQEKFPLVYLEKYLWHCEAVLSSNPQYINTIPTLKLVFQGV